MNNNSTNIEFLGKYKTTGTLGQGAMGIVYSAVDQKLQREVAIKTIIRNESINPDLATEFAKRFEREARAIASLNHRNIVTVFDFGDENQVSYLVMERVHGKDLKYYFENSEYFSISDTVRLMGELLDALDHAHAHGVIHRDIKPANVLIDTMGHVKLADFGVAHIKDSHEFTRVGALIGTLSYMSPEQIRGQHIDHRTDIFSAGVILYQFLTNEKPFTGSDWEIQRKIISDNPSPPSTLKPELPLIFDQIIAKALAKNPDDRFSSAIEFAKTLRSTQDDNETTRLFPPPTQANKQTKLETLSEIPALELKQPTMPRIEAQKDSRAIRHVSLSLAIAAMIAGLVFYVLKNDKSHEIPADHADSPTASVNLPESPESSKNSKADSADAIESGKKVETKNESNDKTRQTFENNAYRNGDNRVGLEIISSKDPSQLKDGESISLLVKPDKAAYIYCFMQDANNVIQRFFPNRFNNNPLVDKEGIRIPGKMRFIITANLKGNRELITCFATNRDVLLDLPSKIRTDDFAKLSVSSMDEINLAFENKAGASLSVAQFSYADRNKPGKRQSR